MERERGSASFSGPVDRLFIQSAEQIIDRRLLEKSAVLLGKLRTVRHLATGLMLLLPDLIYVGRKAIEAGNSA